VTADGVRRWSTLINPLVPIPPYVRHLTGIDADMVRDAPTLDLLAPDLQQRLEGGLFIAHNARFDYGFLRNAFRRLGLALKCEVLCTVKLSRKLFPNELKHSLDALMERHGLQAEKRHRALADADLLWQFWRTLETTLPAETLQAAVLRLLQRPNIPAHLDPDLLDDIPDGPGVYVFYGEHDVPLHVGRASQLRQRVLSYFHADRPSRKDQMLAQELRRIEWHETAGEIGAQLSEMQLVRQLKPAHDHAQRRQQTLCAWQLRPDGRGGMEPVLRHTGEQDFGSAERLYGLFNTRQKAEAALSALTETHALHPDAAGLEAPDERAKRLERALSSLKVMTWPYPGPVGLIETAGDGRRDIHVLDNWCHLGSSHNEQGAMQILSEMEAAPAFDAETYRIVSRALALGKLRVLPAQALHEEVCANAAGPE
jgi:DNA polymerase-3 subunit epsilon